MSTNEYRHAVTEALAAELRAAIAHKGVTASSVAIDIGTTPEQLSRYLRAHRELPVPTLYLIARAIGIEPQVLVEAAYRKTSGSSPSDY